MVCPVCEDNHRLIQAQDHGLSQNPGATWVFNDTLVGVFFLFFSSFYHLRVQVVLQSFRGQLSTV